MRKFLNFVLLMAPLWVSASEYHGGEDLIRDAAGLTRATNTVSDPWRLESLQRQGFVTGTYSATEKKYVAVMYTASLNTQTGEWIEKDRTDVTEDPGVQQFMRDVDRLASLGMASGRRLYLKDVSFANQTTDIPSTGDFSDSESSDDDQANARRR